MAVSVLNSFSATNYLDGETFTGEYFDVLRYAQIVVNITTTSATNSYDIRCYYSNDAITVNSIETFLITNQLNHVETFNATNRFIKIELEPHSTLLNLQVLTILKNQTQIQDVNLVNGGAIDDLTFKSDIVSSIVLPVNNTLANALFVKADANLPVIIQASSTTLPVNNTLANALFVKADANLPVIIQASSTLPVNNTLANALYVQADANLPVSGTVSVSTLPAIAITNTSFDVGNFTPDATTNTFLVAYVITGNWYKVESIGTTSGAQWNGVGAIIGGESQPPVGRVFKALSNAPGTGTVSTIIYSQNVDVSTLPAIAITNTGFNVDNIPHVIVDTLPAINITNTGFNVDNIPHVIVDTLPAINITNTGFNVDNIPHVIVDNAVLEVNIASQTAPVSVDISSSIGLDIANLPAIAITNTSFAITNTNATAIAVKPVASGFAVSITGTLPSPSIHCQSLDAISTTSQLIGFRNRIRTIIVSNIAAALGFNFCYLKIYASSTATELDTPLTIIGVRSGETIVINCDLNVPYTTTAEICCRATDDFSAGSTTAPTGTITASFFIYNS